MKTVLQRLCLFLSAILVSSCASYSSLDIPRGTDSAVVQQELLSQDLFNLPEPIKSPTVAIYRFGDLTGQKKQNAAGGTSFSSAVTQAPDVYLTRALLRAAHGKFFTVIDRTILDDLTKERQLIRQTRQSYDGKNATKLPALKFAGLLVTGGIVGYDHSSDSGGAGARYLGIGTMREFSRDTVTINIRLISVATGEVVLEVISSKTILSTNTSGDVFRFIEQGTSLVEIESGLARNESVSIATQRAIEVGVLELINRGEGLGFWKFKGED